MMADQPGADLLSYGSKVPNQDHIARSRLRAHPQVDHVEAPAKEVCAGSDEAGHAFQKPGKLAEAGMGI